MGRNNKCLIECCYRNIILHSCFRLAVCCCVINCNTLLAAQIVLCIWSFFLRCSSPAPDIIAALWLFHLKYCCPVICKHASDIRVSLSEIQYRYCFQRFHDNLLLFCLTSEQFIFVSNISFYFYHTSIISLF